MKKMNGADLVRQIVNHQDFKLENLLDFVRKSEPEWLEFKAAILPETWELDTKGEKKFEYDTKKENLTNFIWDVAKEVIAMANTCGGAIVLGVDNDGNIVGLDNSDKDKRLAESEDKFTREVLDVCFKPDSQEWRCFKNSYKISSKTLYSMIEYKFVEAKNKKVVFIIVEPIPSKNKLLYVNDTSNKREFIYVRDKGETGRVREYYLKSEIEEYDNSRKQAKNSFNLVYDRYVERLKKQSDEPHVSSYLYDNEIRNLAYKTEIINSLDASKSFLTKLIYKIPLNFRIKDLTSTIKDFKREIKIDNFGYFSKCDISTNKILRESTKDIFVWAKIEECDLPLIYTLDFSKLKGKSKIRITNLKSSSGLYLNSIEMIPVRDYCCLSFNLQGDKIAVEDYLGLVSRRMFGGIEFSNGNKCFDEVKPTISGFIKEITKCVKENREIQISNLHLNSSGEKPIVMQYLLFDDKFEIDPSNKISSVIFNLISTLSRPKIEYPKNDLPRIWQHNDSLDTLYGFHSSSLSCFANSKNEFNTNTKPIVFMKANYFQWLITNELRDSKKSLDSVSNTFTENVRKTFFEKLKK
jgi:hypothetical protein